MRWAIIAAAVIAAMVDALYLGVVQTQDGGDPQFLTVPFVATSIALMASCAALASRASSARWRPLLLGVATGGLLLLGYVGMFSIGLPLLVAGLLLLISLIVTLSSRATADRQRAKARIGVAAGGAVVAVALLLGGFTVSELFIRCPARGQMSGSGLTVLGMSYTYRCENGKLTITR